MSMAGGHGVSRKNRDKKRRTEEGEARAVEQSRPIVANNNSVSYHAVMDDAGALVPLPPLTGFVKYHREQEAKAEIDKALRDAIKEANRPVAVEDTQGLFQQQAGSWNLKALNDQLNALTDQRKPRTIVLHTEERTSTAPKPNTSWTDPNLLGSAFPNDVLATATTGVSNEIQKLIETNKELRNTIASRDETISALRKQIARLTPVMQTKKRTKTDGNTRPEDGNTDDRPESHSAHQA